MGNQKEGKQRKRKKNGGKGQRW